MVGLDDKWGNIIKSISRLAKSTIREKDAAEVLEDTKAAHTDFLVQQTLDDD